MWYPYVITVLPQHSTIGLTDPVDRAIMKFQTHPSILQILENVCNISFSFKTTSLYNLENVIRYLNPKKAGIHNDIPAQNFIQNYDICARFLLSIAFGFDKVSIKLIQSY